MAMHRTTIVGDEADLALLAREAKTRGVSLGRLLGDLAAREAAELRQQRLPLVGTFRSGVAIAEAVDHEDPAARPFRDG